MVRGHVTDTRKVLASETTGVHDRAKQTRLGCLKQSSATNRDVGIT